MLKYIYGLLCWLGYHKTKCTSYKYYDHVECMRCDHSKKYTAWDGWYP